MHAPFAPPGGVSILLPAVGSGPLVDDLKVVVNHHHLSCLETPFDGRKVLGLPLTCNSP